MASIRIMQFRAEIPDAPFPLWRRFQVLENTTFSRLAYILMTMFEMQGNHLFQFDIDFNENFVREYRNKGDYKMAQSFMHNEGRRLRVQLPNEYDDFTSSSEIDSFDAATTIVRSISSRPGFFFEFTYDLGDCWTVNVEIEEIFHDQDLSGRELPRVIEGEGFGIVEDCGGIYGLTGIYQAFKKGKGKEYEQYREWLGVDSLELDSFDIADMNFRLKKVPRIYCDLYEKGLYPTNRSIAILERDYRKI